MIQRIQTLYLLLASIAIIACMSTCIGYFIADDGEMIGRMYNLMYITEIEGLCERSFATWALFVILLLSSTLTLFDIFLFRRRALQMRICVFSIILLLAWYAVYAFFAYSISGSLQTGFRPGFVASIPAVSSILLYLAFRGIMKDEMLVRSLDRLR